MNGDSGDEGNDELTCVGSDESLRTSTQSSWESDLVGTQALILCSVKQAQPSFWTEVHT